MFAGELQEEFEDKNISNGGLFFFHLAEHLILHFILIRRLIKHSCISYGKPMVKDVSMKINVVGL